MAKFAFISDVHSNLEALQAVLSELRGERIFCLGDIVGYGASPNEVISLLEKSGAVSVRGNHDQAVVTGRMAGFNSVAAVAAAWTRNQLTPESLAFLETLPTSLKVDLSGVEAYLTHGSPDDNLWEYVEPATHNALMGHYLTKMGVRLIALGHTHHQFVWRGAEGIVFNPGSVGQPRDGERRCGFAVVEVNGDAVEVLQRRLEYDREGAARKIVNEGLPPILGERLRQGR